MIVNRRPLARPGGNCAVCGIDIDKRSTYCRSHRPKPDAQVYAERSERRAEEDRRYAERLASEAAERQRIIDTAPLDGRVVIVASKGHAYVARWDMRTWPHLRAASNSMALDEEAANPLGPEVWDESVSLLPCPDEIASRARWE